MRTLATLNKTISSADKLTIVRNLNRILDIVILDIDIEFNTITFLHYSKIALESVKNELNCIGYPVRHIQIQNEQKDKIRKVKTLA